MAIINTTTTGILGTTVYGDGAGPLTVQQDGATLGIYGAQPAFSAIRTGGSGNNISLPSATWTKITFNSTDFDTNSVVNTSTGRITPNVAGYYQIFASVYINYASSNIIRLGLSIYKNGSQLKGDTTTGSTAFYGVYTISGLIYFNGSSDYLEIYGFQQSSTDATMLASGTYTYCTGVLVKAT
jgi:hypothetical protein